MTDKVGALWAQLREADFPDGSDDDRLDGVNAEIALLDAFIAGEAATFAETGSVPDSDFDISAGLDSIDIEIARLRTEIAGEEEIVREYQRYAELLRDLHAALSLYR